MKKLILMLMLSSVALLATAASGKGVQRLNSPDGKLVVEVNLGQEITWSLSREGVTLLEPSAISMTLDDGTVFGRGEKLRKISRRDVKTTQTPLYYTKATVPEAYREMTLAFKEFSLVFRAYDEGVAYRFVAGRKAPFKVKAEQAGFRFPGDPKAFVPYTRKSKDNFECQFFTSFESQYTYQHLSAWTPGRLAFLPVTVDLPGGLKVCLTESDLQDYPGLYLSHSDRDAALEAVFAPYPREIEQGGHNLLQGLVRSREDYIAEVAAKEAFPWRVAIVAAEDKDLLDSDLAWLLGAAPKPEADFSWVRPGKVAWDWWNDWNIRGVDFPAGINNETYEYYIDFAARSGIEYVILDEGWAVNRKADLFQVAPEIDLPRLVAYGRERGVGLILWAGYWAFEKDMEKACRVYSEMGIKGFKVDFMDRDDQPMVRFYARAAEMAAKYHLFLDFHGAFKPSGLQRTWPNVINYEGVFGLENAKWGSLPETDLVKYDVTIPFVRLVAGPADYTQGAMRNATRRNYRPVYAEPMSQGTRCRQLAEYVVFYAPLTMLCDSPSNYLENEECLRFIASVPTVWDETRPLEGKAGEYVAVARRKGSTWYVGALTDWSGRELTLDLSFIGGGRKMEIFRDGVNAGRSARDYVHDEAVLPADGRYTCRMAPGGGWVAVIR